MKHSFLLLCAALLAATAPLAPAHADDSVSIDFFYDALSPYGDWIYTPNYGYVWQPLAAQQPGWSPYADGSWVYTDAGWTWVSNEDYGWLTYHYGRWIRMQQNWVWVPGYDWAPAWVSWRQTQGQIGWAPLPPEASWSPGIGFGGWTDSYYDVGPAYYNFVPIGAFASTTSLRPYIMDRNRNFAFYDQSVNVTHTSYQANVTNHIFVGGPDPQRINGFGGNQVRHLTLRRDDEGFRRNWLDHDRRNGGNGAPPRGAGSPSRIEQGQLFLAAPSIRRDPSHALPSRVREPFHQPEIDRGWRGAPDAQSANRLREQQRDELARTRPPNLPDKNHQPATSTAPPPAFGRPLRPDERSSSGVAVRDSDPRHKAEEIRPPTTPKTPLPAGGPPGVPGKVNEEPGNRGTVTNDVPRREHRTEGQLPGNRPGENNAPPPGGQRPPGVPPMDPGTGAAPQPAPQTNPPKRPAPQAAPSDPPKHDVPQAAPEAPPRSIPDASSRQPGFPGHRQRQEQPPGASPAQHPRNQPLNGPAPAPPAAPPRAAPAPMPPPHPQQPPPVRTLPPQRGNAAPTAPVAPPTAPAPQQPQRHNPAGRDKK